MRLGLLGGTFDPPHLAHLMLAELAREQLALDRVLFLPAGEPPHKPDGPRADSEARLAMTGLAIAGNPAFTLDRTDVDRPPPHTTVTLLPRIAAAYPGAALWLLLGSDSLRDLPAWHEPERILTQCRLAVLPRPGVEVAWEPLEAALPGIRARVLLLDGPTISLSSTELRRRAQAGQSVRYLVPDGVRAFFEGRRLYRSETDGPTGGGLTPALAP